MVRPAAEPAPVFETVVETHVVCPAGVAERVIERDPPAPPAGAVVTANDAGDAWLDKLLAWGGRAWTTLAGDQAECIAAKAAQ